MERALLQGELTAQLEKILQDEKWIEQLMQKDQKLAAELEEFRFEEGAKIQTSKSKMESIEMELNKYVCRCCSFRSQWHLSSPTCVLIFCSLLDIFLASPFDRLEEECDAFSGTTDEETALLEKIKFQHELLDTERKVIIV